MKKVLVLFIVIFLLFSTGVNADILTFNPEHEGLNFSVEGSLTANFLFINPRLDFSGSGVRNENNENWLTPLIKIENANFNVLIFSFGEDSATELAEDLIGSMVGITDSQEEAMDDYYLVEDENTYFIYKDLFDLRPTNSEIIRVIEDEEIEELAEKRGFTDGRMYGGEMKFSQDDLLVNLLAYSDDWWADLSIEWKEVGEKYNFPKRATGEGFHDRPIDLKVEFFDYEVY